ncbi:MAG: DUF4197 domain-containing protein [Bacteroidetes bacterium]|nr:DUF4197 domain-containing protein [Bacteroidota bacterium]
MKKNLLFAVLFSFIFISFSCSISDLEKALLMTGTGTGLTEQDAASGIREALIQGTSKGVVSLSKLDGYFGNPQIKIPFPPEAKAIEQNLRSIGLDKQVNQVVLSLNRAAENAAQEAKPIFVAAIKKMTIADAVNIVRGNNDAATRYLERNTTNELSSKFQPVIKSSLDKVNATKYWSDIINTYNTIPLVEKVNPNLTQYVTDKALNGLFTMIAKEELAIRKDPVARTSEILKKVFGGS